MDIFQHPLHSKKPDEMGEAAGLYYPWTRFHRAETHALPHSSSLHNWKHLGMKIESRWHINGRILQGHADKKTLLLLTGHFQGCWPSLKEYRRRVDVVSQTKGSEVERFGDGSVPADASSPASTKKTLSVAKPCLCVRARGVMESLCSSA